LLKWWWTGTGAPMADGGKVCAGRYPRRQETLAMPGAVALD
jgi:hypothetical protein